MYSMRDPDYTGRAAATYARSLREEFEQTLRDAGIATTPPVPEVAQGEAEAGETEEAWDASPEAGTDIMAAFEANAIEALRSNADLMSKIRGDGAAWGAVKAFFVTYLPENLEDRDNIAFNLVTKALNSILGPQHEAWHAFRTERGTTHVRAGRAPSS